MQTSSSVTLATIDRHLHRYGIRSLGTSTDIGSVGSGDRSGADVCIWLRTPLRLEG
jgi:hypothetical protein